MPCSCTISFGTFSYEMRKAVIQEFIQHPPVANSGTTHRWQSSEGWNLHLAVLQQQSPATAPPRARLCLWTVFVCILRMQEWALWRGVCVAACFPACLLPRGVLCPSLQRFVKAGAHDNRIKVHACVPAWHAYTTCTGKPTKTAEEERGIIFTTVWFVMHCTVTRQIF